MSRVIARQVGRSTWDVYTTEEQFGAVVESLRGRVVCVNDGSVGWDAYEAVIGHGGAVYLRIDGQFSGMAEALNAVVPR